MTVKQYALNIQCKLSTRNIKYTLMQLQQGLLFKVVMAAGIRLVPKQTFLQLSARYLRPEVSKVKVVTEWV